MECFYSREWSEPELEMPETEQEVLVVVEQDSMYFITIADWRESESGPAWYDQREEWSGGRVVLWMNLPLLPKDIQNCGILRSGDC